MERAMDSGWAWKVNIRVRVWLAGKVVREELVHNVITRGAFTLARDALRGQGDPTFVIVGVGANGDPPSDEDTSLGDERLRVPILRRDPVGVDGLLTTAYVSPGVANDFTINEIGWWGEDATTTVDTGTLMSRVLFNHTKTNLESIQIDRIDTFSEAP